MLPNQNLIDNNIEEIFKKYENQKQLNFDELIQPFEKFLLVYEEMKNDKLISFKPFLYQEVLGCLLPNKDDKFEEIYNLIVNLYQTHNELHQLKQKPLKAFMLSQTEEEQRNKNNQLLFNNNKELQHKIQQYQDQLKEISEHNQNLLSLKEESAKEIVYLKEKSAQDQKQQSQLQSELNEVKLKLKEMEQQQTELKTQSVQQQEIINTKNSQNDNLSQHITILEEKIKSLDNQQEINQKQLLELQEQLKIQNDELHLDLEVKNLSDFKYDMIVNLNSILSLQDKGILIEKANENFNHKVKDAVVVALIGYRNKGKTFILNSLIADCFPSGFHVNTPGLCIKVDMVKKTIVYLDSQGQGEPTKIDFNSNQNYQKFIESKNINNFFDSESEQKLKDDIAQKDTDQKITEKIIQDFIQEKSNILIIPFSQTSIEDQKLIRSISNKANSEKHQLNGKIIIVVHNLMDLRLSKHVYQYIEKIKNNFTLKELKVPLPGQWNTKEYNKILCDEINTNIVHVILGFKGSEAGNIFNRFGIQYIKQQIGTYQNLVHFDIIQNLKDYLNKNLEQYVQIQECDNYVKQLLSDKSEIIEYDQENQKLCLKQGLNVKLNDLNLTVYGDLHKDNQYSIVRSEDDKKLYVFVVIPGEVAIKKIFYKKDKLLKIIVKSNKLFESESGLIQQSTRKLEIKPIIIQLSSGNELWNMNDNEEENLCNGIYKFTFEKEEEEEEWI